MTDVERHATYGELWRLAARHVWTANLQLTTTPIPDADAARRAISAWQQLLHACHTNAVLLAGGADRIRSLRQGTQIEERDAAALEMLDSLSAYLDRAAPPPAEPVDALHHHDGRQAPAGQRIHGYALAAPHQRPLAGRWDAARRLLGAATDLLATHRGPAAPALRLDLTDPDVRDAGLSRLARLVTAAASAVDPLALRAGQAGVDWAEVRAALPPPTAALAAAPRLRAMVPERPGGADRRLADIRVARPGIRRGNVLDELVDRVERLHRVAHDLPDQPRVGIATVVDLARTAVGLHQATSRLLQAAATRGAPDASDLMRELALVDAAGSAWTQSLLALRELRTASPVMSGVRADTIAIRLLLAQVIDTDTRFRPRAYLTLLHLTRLQPAVARQATVTVGQLAAAGQLYVSARTLDGDTVTHDPHLASAKLVGRHVMAPAPRLDEVVQSLAEASREPERTLERLTTRAPRASIQTEVATPML